MPSISLRARRTRNATRKNIIIVTVAMASSALGRYHRLEAVGSEMPNVERPRALRIMVSKCSSAAVATGDDVAPSTDSAVAVDGNGGGRWVARNM